MTSIFIAQTTADDVFSTDQTGDLTREQAGIIAARFNAMFMDRAEEMFPEAEIEVGNGNGLDHIRCDDDEIVNRLAATADRIWESAELWEVTTVKSITFKRYTWGEYEANDADGLAQAGVEWDSLPNQYGEWDDVMAAAEWRDNDETGVGVLTREWNGHPEGALIVSDDTRPGLDFAVSNEAVS